MPNFSLFKKLKLPMATLSTATFSLLCQLAAAEVDDIPEHSYYPGNANDHTQGGGITCDDSCKQGWTYFGYSIAALAGVIGICCASNMIYNACRERALHHRQNNNPANNNVPLSSIQLAELNAVPVNEISAQNRMA